MTGPEPVVRRVRVTSPRATGRRSHTPSVPFEIDTQTQVGEVYMRSLMRTQLRLALAVTCLLAGSVGALPVLFVVAPALRAERVAGVPLPWLVLGVVVYPFLVLLGWLYVRRAERNEQRFSDLVERR